MSLSMENIPAKHIEWNKELRASPTLTPKMDTLIVRGLVRTSLRPGARVDQTPASGMPLLQTGVARDPFVDVPDVQSARRRGLADGLVELDAAEHAQTYEKGPYNRSAAYPMDLEWMCENASTPSTNSLVARIKDEARLCARAGARGPSAILPQTWDVH